MQLYDKDFIRIKDYMYQHFGLNLATKKSLIEGRLSVTVAQKGFADFSSYIDHMLKDTSGAEISLLVSKLTTNFTYFMREEMHFQYLAEKVLPEWTTRIQDFDLRIWSAGCSSGEEPYSIAMVLDSYFGIKKNLWDTVILASDISHNVLDEAKRGIYNVERMAKLPDVWKKKHFTKNDNDTYTISKAIKEQVDFRDFNLMSRSFPFRKKFHVIFCRNVMIYFDTPTRQAVIEKYYDALAPGGYLFIGMSETMANLNTPFRYMQPSIYKKQ